MTAFPETTDLLAWFDREGRDLPWRRTRDPWAVLVSELMLQQTQVARVVPRFEAFLERWPDPATLAASPVGDLVAFWVGLGYNRRAVNLHRAATEVVRHHDGRLPTDLSGLLSLPGIGPYTARAVLAFAYEADGVGVLDTNVARILARQEGRSLGRAEAQRRADDAVPAGAAWAWNQAMLDLGATRCRPREPVCDDCPLRGACAWASAGRPDPDPAVGSAGVSAPQSRFEGSDRQGRGRLVAALRHGPVAPADVARVAGWPASPDRAERAARSLVADGLAVLDESGVLHLPA